MTGLRERKKLRTRQAIVAAADELFSRDGFQATTMEDIAAAAEVSVGTLYNYFGTKNALLLAQLATHVEQMMGAGADVVERAPPDLTTAVGALVVVYVDGFLEVERELLREVFAAGFGPSSELLPELIRLDELLADQLGALLGQFAASGDLAPNVEVAEAVLTVYSLLATQLLLYVSVEDMSPDDVQRAVARQIEIVCTGLRAPER